MSSTTTSPSSPSKRLHEELPTTPSPTCGTLLYYPIRGRAEPIRLALVIGEEDWKEETLEDFSKVSTYKNAAGTSTVPFGQFPIWKDDIHNGFTLSQMDAILRHIGRRHLLYGYNPLIDARIDELLGGVESIRQKYAQLIYEYEVENHKKMQYFNDYIHPDSAKGKRNGGAHFFYLEELVKRNRELNTSTPWSCGPNLTIGDVQIFDIVDVHIRIFDQQSLRTPYPLLFTIYDKIHSIQQVQSYLASNRRWEKVNNNGKG
jgi:glutathione S-transferase